MVIGSLVVAPQPSAIRWRGDCCTASRSSSTGPAMAAATSAPAPPGKTQSTRSRTDRDAVARAGAEAARVEEGEVVLGVAQGQHVVRRELEEAQHLLDPGALGHAGGQQHEGGAVRDQVPGHLGRAQRLAHRRLVAAAGADDDPAHLVVDAPPLELSEQPAGHRGSLVADHRRAGIVDHRAVLGHHAVEELQAVAHARELEEGAPGHEHQPEARLLRPLERGAHRRTDPVIDRERAVEIASERLEEHVSGTGAILVPRRPDRKTP